MRAEVVAASEAAVASEAEADSQAAAEADSVRPLKREKLSTAIVDASNTPEAAKMVRPEKRPRARACAAIRTTIVGTSATGGTAKSNPRCLGCPRGARSLR